MRRHTTLLACLAVVALLAARCSDDSGSTTGPTVPTTSQLVGLWQFSDAVFDGTVSLSFTMQFGDTSFTIDTTMLLDTTLVLDPDSNWLDLREDSTYVQATTVDPDSLISNPMAKASSAGAMVATAETTMDSGTWWMDGSNLVQQSYGSTEAMSSVPTLSGNSSLTLTVAMDTSVSVPMVGYVDIDGTTALHGTRAP